MAGHRGRLDLAFSLRNVLFVALYAVGLVVLVPVLRERQWAVGPFLVGLAVFGTLVYARYGLVVTRTTCETCGERTYLGALWCPGHGAMRPAARPVAQITVAAGLLLFAGAVAGGFRTGVLWLVPPGSPAWDYLTSDGYGLFRAYFLLYALVASVAVPVVLGNAVRAVVRLERRFRPAAE